MEHVKSKISPLHIAVHSSNQNSMQLNVSISHSVISALYKHTAQTIQPSIQAFGFHKGTVPVTYIEQNFKPMLLEHIKEFLLKYQVFSHLYQEIKKQSLPVAGEPRLISVDADLEKGATFNFEVSLFPHIQFLDWKYFPFKAPKRKKYKDLDRQVNNFVQEEFERKEKRPSQQLCADDWVNLNITLVSNSDGKPVLDDYIENIWYKIGDEEADTELRELLLNHTVGESFCTKNHGLQTYFSEQLDSNYTYHVSISDTVPASYFDLEQFKNYFKIKTNKALKQKLVEVFSYRNDISQRRAMGQEALQLILSKHRFMVPTHLAIRQQRNILEVIQNNPDYHVYRMQKDFKYRIQQLAERQTKEMLILDQIAHEEKLSVTHDDIKGYLNLTNRARMKEFIYFDPPLTKIKGRENPIAREELARACLREKTLNHIIYHLTKQ